MLLDIFTWLSGALNSSPAVAITGAFLWGVASIILSPCHLAGIPLIIGFISGQRNMTAARAFIYSSVFSLGLLVTIALIGIITGLMGKMMGDIGPFGTYAVALLFFVIGLHMLGLLPLPFMGGGGQPAFAKKGIGASFVLGLVFGLALGPCSFAFMMPVLGTVFAVASRNMLFAVALVAAYAAGHCSVIVLAGSFTGKVQRLLQWNEHSKGLDRLKMVCGVLVILGGIYLIATSR